jgi:hypothetical protein
MDSKRYVKAFKQTNTTEGNPAVSYTSTLTDRPLSGGSRVAPRSSAPSEAIRKEIAVIANYEASLCWEKVKTRVAKLDGIKETLGERATKAVEDDVTRAVINAFKNSPYKASSDVTSCMSDLLRRCDGLSLT